MAYWDDEPQFGIRVEATIRGLNQFTKKLEPQALFAGARDGLYEVLEELKLIVRENTPYDTGEASGTLYIEVNGTTVQDLEGIVASPEEYFINLEYGRRAGSRMPPSAPIEEWAYRHGMGLSAVFPLRRAIARRGIPARHMMRNALNQGRQHFAYVFFKRFLVNWGRS